MKKFLLRTISVFLAIYTISGIPYIFQHLSNGNISDAIVLTVLLAFLVWIIVRIWRTPKASPKRVSKNMTPVQHSITTNPVYSKKEQTSKQSIDPTLKMVMDDLQKGVSPTKIAQKVSEITGMDYDECEEQVLTFASCYHGQEDISAYEAAGIEEYEFMAALDDRTCPVCGALDGKHFKVKNAEIGVNYPPMHLGCRCTTVEYDPEEAADWDAIGEPMPERMTYEEWKTNRPYEIIQESRDIIRKTTDIGVFLSRYELILTQAKSLKDRNVFETYAQSYNSYLKEFIHRYYQDALKLKTERGRNARIAKLCDALQTEPAVYDCMKFENNSVVSILTGPIEEKQKLLK